MGRGCGRMVESYMLLYSIALRRVSFSALEKLFMWLVF